MYFFGPLNYHVAALESFIVTIPLVWCLLLLAEMSVIKALLICKWSWIVEVDESFAGRFLFRVNVGFAFIATVGR